MMKHLSNGNASSRDCAANANSVLTRSGLPPSANIFNISECRGTSPVVILEISMNFTASLATYRPYLLGILRIVFALLFVEHGTMKLFGFPAAAMSGSLPPLLLTAACLELLGGLLLAAGLFTRPVAFILSGEMAFAYFIGHFPHGFFPGVNQGEGAIMYCFFFLYLAVSGPGAWALDKVIFGGVNGQRPEHTVGAR